MGYAALQLKVGYPYRVSCAPALWSQTIRHYWNGRPLSPPSLPTSSCSVSFGSVQACAPSQYSSGCSTFKQTWPHHDLVLDHTCWRSLFIASSSIVILVNATAVAFVTDRALVIEATAAHSTFLNAPLRRVSPSWTPNPEA